jgi:hypothetical protein
VKLADVVFLEVEDVEKAHVIALAARVVSPHDERADRRIRVVKDGVCPERQSRVGSRRDLCPPEIAILELVDPGARSVSA